MSPNRCGVRGQPYDCLSAALGSTRFLVHHALYCASLFGGALPLTTLNPKVLPAARLAIQGPIQIQLRFATAAATLTPTSVRVMAFGFPASRKIEIAAARPSQNIKNLAQT